MFSRPRRFDFPPDHRPACARQIARGSLGMALACGYFQPRLGLVQCVQGPLHVNARIPAGQPLFRACFRLARTFDINLGRALADKAADPATHKAHQPASLRVDPLQVSRHPRAGPTRTPASRGIRPRASRSLRRNDRQGAIDRQKVTIQKPAPKLAHPLQTVVTQLDHPAHPVIFAPDDLIRRVCLPLWWSGWLDGEPMRCPGPRLRSA